MMDAWFILILQLMNTDISTEIIFTEKQDISAVEIFIGLHKFILSGID